MTNTSKVLLGSIGTFLAIILLSAIYLAIGASVFGPKTEVSEACKSIKGKNFSAAATIVDQYKGMDFMDADSDNWVQISKVSGGWICFCHAQTEDDSSDSLQVTEVYCSD